MSRRRRVTYFGTNGDAGSLEVRYAGRDENRRPRFDWTIRDTERNVLGQGSDILLGRGRPDSLTATAVMCDFMLYAADVHRSELHGTRTDDLDLFQSVVREFCYVFEAEIAAAREELGRELSTRDTGDGSRGLSR